MNILILRQMIMEIFWWFVCTWMTKFLQEIVQVGEQVNRTKSESHGKTHGMM